MRKLKIANSREYNIKMTYYLMTIQTIVCLTGVILTGYSISIVNMSKQDDGSITGEILHWLDYPSVYNSQQTDVTLIQ